MVKAVAALINFCYLVRCDVIDETTLVQIQNTLDTFHHHWEIFREVGICPDGFSLPWQHSLTHYIFSITQFGAPNGLCSSITESKHIKAVKQLYRCSGKNKPLGQMLITNQHIDKLAAARVHFTSLDMLDGSPHSMAGVMLGIFSSRHEPQANTIARDHSTQPHDHNASINDRSRHDSRSEDDPEAGAEISLAKTYGAHYISFFCDISHQDNCPSPTYAPAAQLACIED